MDHDHRYDAKALHEKPLPLVLREPLNAPLPAYTPEFTIGQVTGYAVTEDGMTCVVRTLTPDGIELRLVLPTVQVEAMVGALRAAKTIAAGRANIEDGKTSVFTPGKYETITTENYDGVLLAFDRGLASELVVGLDPDAAYALGVDLRKQVKNNRKLILPRREITGV
jgi:hypothetical protein